VKRSILSSECSSTSARYESAARDPEKSWVNSKFEKVKMVKVEKERELAIRELSISGSGSCAQNDVD